jgi:hypothetical protein
MMAVMTRRSFIESVAAMVAASAIGKSVVLPKQPTIDYSLFCDPYPGCRYDLTTPFDLRGLRYASDARVLVCHESDGLSVDGDRPVPDVSALWWGEFESRGWQRLPDSCIHNVAPKYDENCETCYGKGRIGSGVVLCPACEGEDWCKDIRIEGVNAEQHPDCASGWIGGAKCETCNGSGHHRNVGTMSLVQGRIFGTGYLNKLRTLGEVETRIIDAPQKDAGVMVFRFGDSGRGFLMGIDPDFV